MKNWFYIFIAASFLSACTEKIEVDIPENTEKLVVEGAVTSELDSSFIRLTQSVGFFDDNKPTPTIENATVTVNGVPFLHTTKGIYKPAASYLGTAGNTYNLIIAHNGKQYTSSSTLEPMFKIDTVVPVFKAAQGFLEEGYTVAYFGFDTRPQIKYTYVRFGFKGKDSINESYSDFRVLFDNKGQDPTQPVVFEIPFVRLNIGDTSLLIFRSIDQSLYRYLLALGNRGGGGPFSTPPANLPSNIKGENALGLFAAYDVVRFRTRIR